MRILQVNAFFDLQGSSELYVHDLIREQREAGHEVHAFSTVGEKNVPSADAESFVARNGSTVSRVWNLEAKAAFERLLDRVRPDVVHLHHINYYLSSSILLPIRQRLIPCVQTLHDYALVCPSGKMYTEGSPCERCKGGKYQNTIVHHCLGATFLPNALAAFEMGMTKAAQSYEKTARLFLCPSRFLKEKMEDWGEPPGKLRHLPKPVKLPEKAASRNGGYVLYAGSLLKEKGLDVFIEAAAMVPELPVKIVGRGPEGERLRELVKTKGANHIEFLGLLTPVAWEAVRDRAEAVVLPSRRYENAPSAILEAMAAGIPCLASRIGGIPELIEDNVNGFLATAGDTQDWLRILRRFRALPEDARHDMGIRSRLLIQKNHLWTTHIDRVMTCYQDAGA